MPVLSRLGIESTLGEHPHLVEGELPARLIHHLAHRLGVDPDDPVLAAAPIAEDASPIEEHVVASWLTAARRWCRRTARLGLFDLAHREGRIASTRTHLDVLFSLDQVDLRLRRAGLDVDPGWLPWFGRVVRFHYLEKEGSHV